MWLVLLFALGFIVSFWICHRFRPLMSGSEMEKLLGFRSSLAADREKIVVCFGDDLTRGNISFNYVHALASRLEPWGYTVLNGGVNREHAWNLLQRIETVLAVEPTWVVLLAGTQDAVACASPSVAKSQARRMRLPTSPSESSFTENYAALLDGFENFERSRLIPITLPPLAEGPSDPANGVVNRFNVSIEQESTKRGLEPVPLNQLMTQILLASADEPVQSFQFKQARKLKWAALALHYLFGWTWNQISTHNKMQLLTDMIHLNETSGGMLVEALDRRIRGGSDPLAPELHSVA